MPWENLDEDLQEEFSSIGLDARSLYNDGLRWRRREQDIEDRQNYMRWYRKQVWYPKNRERILKELKEEYALHRSLQDEWWKRRVATFARIRKLQSTKGTKEYQRKLEYMRAWKKRKYNTDPEYRAKKVAQDIEARKRRLARDPAYAEKYKAYMKAYHAKCKRKRKLGKTSTGGAGE